MYLCGLLEYWLNEFLKWLLKRKVIESSCIAGIDGFNGFFGDKHSIAMNRPFMSVLQLKWQAGYILELKTKV